VNATGQVNVRAGSIIALSLRIRNDIQIAIGEKLQVWCQILVLQDRRQSG